MLALGVLGGPLVPTGVVEAAAEDVEHGVVGQPGEVVLAELLEAGALVVAGVVEEVGGGLFDQRKLEAGGLCRSRRGRRAREGLAMRSCGDPAIVNEALQADEEGIAGEGGESGVGRTSVAGGTEREHLPETLLCGGEKVNEGVGGGAEVADAAVGGQRGYMQQNSGHVDRDWLDFRAHRLPLLAARQRMMPESYGSELENRRVGDLCT